MFRSIVAALWGILGVGSLLSCSSDAGLHSQVVAPKRKTAALEAGAPATATATAQTASSSGSAASGSDFVASGSGSIAAGSPAVAPARVATLADFWSGKARWQKRSILPLSTSGEHIVVGPVDPQRGTRPWYHFHGGGPPNPSCATKGWGIMVSTSWDKGATWSADAPVLQPSTSAGQPWQCFVTDGRFFYDEAATTWHGLVQCLSTDSVWNGCHVSLQGTDPTQGGWTGTLSVHSGDLWSKICTPGKRCYSPVGIGQEGTFDIFQKDAQGYFWVAFHGAENILGPGMRMYRGIAKTADFINWDAGGAGGTPVDSVFDAVVHAYPGNADVNEVWPAHIGGGAGDIAVENGFFYLMVEASDIENPSPNGGATRWDQVMGRTNDLSNANWDFSTLAPHNPVFLSAINADGSLSTVIRSSQVYPHIFKDPDDGSLHLVIGQDTTDINNLQDVLYDLQPTNNLLPDGDILSSLVPPLEVSRQNMNRAVYREPWNSTNNGQHFLANCNGPCQSGDAVAHQIQVPAGLAGIDVTAKLSLRASAAATASLQIVQLGADGSTLGSPADSGTLQLTTAWQSFSTHVAVLPNAASLRYQVSLFDQVNYDFDDLYLGRSDGN